MSNLKLSDLERFIALLHQAQRVKRFVHRPGEKEPSNTGEHTFELAMLCWYIAEVEKLNLNHEKIVKYALAHDLIEAYSGDTPAYDTEGQKTKADREKVALERIRLEFPEFPELISLIEEYESKATEESRFVYAADKLIDPLGVSLETIATHWKEKGVSYNDMRTYKDAKIAQYPLIQKYWELLCVKFEKNLGFYFKE
jgi:putative hydrolase of HD superfamily